MPTFTTVALENLLHHKVSESPKKSDRDAAGGAPKHLIIMPALYSTPEQAPLPEDVAPHSPSPYVVNHKRRGWGNEGTAPPQVSREGDELSLEEEEPEVVDNAFGDEFVGGDDSSDEDERFFDRGDLESSSEVDREASIEEATDSTKECIPRSFVSAPVEFFDAIDEFASDGSISNISLDDDRIELELHNSRINLLEEIERRKSAEGRLALMHSQWERIRNIMSEAGLTFPAFPSSADGVQLKDFFVDQISQEITVARLVAESVGRGQARAEAEEAASVIIESKDLEILRLRDRLQYYETVNHELSQRNLVEVARRQHERKRRHRKWVWGFMGLSIAAGLSVVGYSYIPEATKHSSILDFDNGCGDA